MGTEEDKVRPDPDKLMACLEVGKLLTSTVSRDRILELIMHRVSQLIEADNWSLLLIDRETGELTFEVVVGLNEERFKGLQLAPGEGIAGHVARTGEQVFITHAGQDPRFNPQVDELTGFSTESIACIPLQIYGETLGVMEILNLKDMEAFRAQELPVLNILADYAAIAIENSRCFARIERMTVTDEYTGLYNARYLHQVLDEFIRQAQQKGTGIAVVFADIDNFKEVVDTFGHLAGSRMLKEIGESIAGCLAERDVLIKYGGDEYVIILPDVTRREAVERIKRVHRKIRESSYLTSEPTTVRATASLGIAMYPDDASTKKDLLIKADNAMYRVKRSDKDGIGTTQSPPRQGPAGRRRPERRGRSHHR
jgi:diguanylate cyclase (GGDEF)-like protein